MDKLSIGGWMPPEPLVNLRFTELGAGLYQVDAVGVMPPLSKLDNGGLGEIGPFAVTVDAPPKNVSLSCSVAKKYSAIVETNPTEICQFARHYDGVHYRNASGGLSIKAIAPRMKAAYEN